MPASEYYFDVRGTNLNRTLLYQLDTGGYSDTPTIIHGMEVCYILLYIPLDLDRRHKATDLR